jgi:uncharacterized protein (TIGR00369 family)
VKRRTLPPALLKATRERLQGRLSGALGMRLDQAVHGRVRLSMPHREIATQPWGVLHGGAIVSLCDTAAGVGSILMLPADHRTVTAELKVNFLGNVTSGRIVAEARILHHGKHTLVWEVRAWKSGDSKYLLAACLATFFVIPPKK